MLEVVGLTAGYRPGAPVLHEVSLALGPGQVLAVMGRNGAGKTTLLKAILGFARREAGSVRLLGRPLDGLAPEQVARAGIGWVPQGRGVFPGLSVAENLRLGALGTGRPPPGPALLARFPALVERADRPADNLSGGEQRQLAIARALAGEPRLLLLDEPSEGLQPSRVDELARTLETLVAETGLALLLVEQNLDLAVELADAYLVLEDGRVVEQLSGAELADDPARLERRLGL